MRLALDTGATQTIIDDKLLRLAGYSPELSTEKVEIRTASGLEQAAEITLDKIEALEQERTNFVVLSHALPEGARIDGLLGLDFVRDRKLEVDFRLGLIALS